MGQEVLLERREKQVRYHPFGAVGVLRGPVECESCRQKAKVCMDDFTTHSLGSLFNRPISLSWCSIESSRRGGSDCHGTGRGVKS